MKNRIREAIRKAAKEKRKLFCAYLTLGYPNIFFTAKLIRQMENLGVDFIELGFPFSDPLADGPVIQKASEYALARKVVLRDAIKLAKNLRREGFHIPLIFFSYYNPIFHQGAKGFLSELRESGFDGVICPDLPPDEDSFFHKEANKKGLAMIYLASPTTSSKRLRLIAERSRGFIYYVSLKGVTGIRRNLSRDLKEQVLRIKKVSPKPVLIGFGVSNPDQVRQASKISDGVIVGSAIVNLIEKSDSNFEKVTSFVKRLVDAAHKTS